MNRYKSIFLTDETNRYNQVIPLKIMCDMYLNQWNDKIISNSNHDRTKPIGFSRMNGLVITPECSYIVGNFNVPSSKEDEEEVKQMNKLYLDNLNDMKKSIFDDLLNKINNFVDGNYDKYCTNGPFIVNKGIIKRIFPKLIEKLDKDGLIELKYLKPILPGIYEMDGFAIFANKFYRRSFSYYNSLNSPFLERIQTLDLEDLSVKISIDLDAIGLANEQKLELEYQYWWGPKFNDKLNSIPEGVTTHRNEHFNYLLSPIKQMEFGWYTQDNKHTFECEELIEDSNIGNEMYGCRFVHSMVNENDKPMHLDGAVRIYNLEKYIGRSEIKIDKFGRDAEYVKLWRVDNELEVNVWKSLISDFYRDNMLAGEYFDGKDDKIKDMTEIVNDTYEDYTPCELDSNSGIIIQFSFQQSIDIKNGYDVEMQPTIYAPYGEVMEALSPTINKYLLSKKIKLLVEDSLHISFGDMIFNLPTYCCNSIDSANRVFECLQEYIIANFINGNNALISFSLNMPYDKEKCVLLSFAGDTSAFIKLFKSKKMKMFPSKIKDIFNWLEEIYSLEKEIFHPKSKIKLINFLNNGLLTIKRMKIDDRLIDKIEKNEKGICLHLKIEKEKLEYIKKNMIKFSGVMLEKEVECSKCGGDYFKCKCFITAKNGITLKVKDAKLLHFIWTKRKA